MTACFWRKDIGIGLTDHWKLISLDDEEVIASITNYNQTEWDVWLRGAGAGSYVSLAAAKAKALKVARATVRE